ncbi:MAG: LysR family transcriptional regulator [Pseudomonadota bacterium]
MKDWQEIRTASYVARFGTVSEAAKELGVHRATVVRHIDTLETRLGEKIFRRHSSGYSTTELGAELLSTADRIESEISHFVATSKVTSSSLSGELIIATTPPAYAGMIVALTRRMQSEHPDLRITFRLTPEQPRLELGEADIYFHFGPTIDNPDYVVRPALVFQSGIYGHDSYFRKHGNPQHVSDFLSHKFALLTSDTYSQYSNWLRQEIPADNVIFQSNDLPTVYRTAIDGLALAPMPQHVAQSVPGMRQIEAAIPAYDIISWIVTHVDMHRSPKVQALLTCLRDEGILGKPAIDLEPDRLLSF